MLHLEYMNQRKFYSRLGLGDRRVIRYDLLLVISGLDRDFNFLINEDKYAAKQRQLVR